MDNELSHIGRLYWRIGGAAFYPIAPHNVAFQTSFETIPGLNDTVFVLSETVPGLNNTILGLSEIIPGLNSKVLVLSEMIPGLNDTILGLSGNRSIANQTIAVSHERVSGSSDNDRLSRETVGG